MLIRRPRTSDVLTRFDAVDGARYVWTTFSPDQVDLNFHNPFVLLWVIETLLLYVRQGADIIRLDAVTYLWCELGTDCASLGDPRDNQALP
jgi:sucrose phosphorylase